MARAESSPREETDLVPLFAILPLKLEVVYRPLAFRLGEIGEEMIVVVRTGRLLDDDLGVIFVEVEDDIFELLLQLERLVCR